MRLSTRVFSLALILSFCAIAALGAAPSSTRSGFTPQTKIGFTKGDQWEPAIAADAFGHVYVLYPQYISVPGCATCPDPSMTLVVSGDGGATWGAPRLIAQTAGPQYDAQIVVDPADRRTVYAAWLQNGKSDIAVAKSTDFGATWNVVIANSTNAATDKPILVARGADVYVAYNHTQKVWISSSHDGGRTFTSSTVVKTGLGWSLAGGGAIDNAGNVYFSWSGYEGNGGAKGPVNLFISKSSDGGSTWSTALLDISGAPPDCSDFLCGWAYLGAQAVMTSDAAGNLYALWNAGATNNGPERIYFSRSTDQGRTWSQKQNVSLAADGTAHAFPAVAATGSGDVRIAWMDARNGSLWNVYYRTSRDGGRTWSAEADLSTYVDGFEYIKPAGFGYPFGDYFELEIDPSGRTHAIWGEGLNYLTPGSIWYARQR